MNLRVFFCICLFLFFISCSINQNNSGPLNNNSNNNKNNSAVSLQISGNSSFISSDIADDICPFVFRDTNTGNATLFFSSDRLGLANTNFKIYYATMLSDETFQPPVLMSSIINNPVLNVISPNVFRIGGDIYLVALCIGINKTNVLSFKLDSSFNVTSTNTNFSLNALSINLYQVLNQISMLICDGTANMTLYLIQTNGIWSNMGIITTQNPINSISGYGVVNIMNATANSYFLLGLTNNQFSGMSFLASFIYTNNQLQTNAGSLSTNYFATPSYKSIYSDITPFIDVKVGMTNSKVYFSSKRTGTYDLYRYNTITFDTVIPQ